MEPVISIQIRPEKDHFVPDEAFECEYRVEADPANQIQAVEASVLWYTEGKGEEDLAVHYFERHVAADVERGDLRGTRGFSTVLPPSPLSYDGVIVKLRWCVRIRVFMRRGRNVAKDLPLRLGRVPPGHRLETETMDSGEGDEFDPFEEATRGEPSTPGGKSEAPSNASELAPNTSPKRKRVDLP